jgi:hypothetical protein
VGGALTPLRRRSQKGPEELKDAAGALAPPSRAVLAGGAIPISAQAGFQGKAPVVGNQGLRRPLGAKGAVSFPKQDALG